MADNKESIPVIGINDQIVEEDRVPTFLMINYFNRIVHLLKQIIPDDAPKDGKLYGRRNGQWIEII
jgi:hypothetical protein